MKLPDGTTTISGQSGQSLNVSSTAGVSCSRAPASADASSKASKAKPTATRVHHRISVPHLSAASPGIIPNSLQNPKILVGVESRRGAVAWALWASLRFLSPLIKPDVRISRIRLPDRLHLKAHGGGPRWTRLCRITPSSPNATVSGKPGATRRHLMAPDQEMTYSLVRSSSLIPDNQFGSPAPPSP